MTTSDGPLAGLVVVDLSTTLASAYTSLVFADFGAEVIQIEPPGGSPLRRQASWPFWMRGKKSIELDLASAADAAVARKLAGGADVVIDGGNPGVAAAAGLDDADLRPTNRGLIYASITAFGRTGPLAPLKPYESIVMAKMGGTYGHARTGRHGPVMLAPNGATMAAALLAVQGICVALHERSTSGHGQRVDATMCQGMLAQDPWAYFLLMLAQKYSAGLTMAPPRAPGRPVPNSWLGFGLLTAHTADHRWLQFAHATPRQFEAFLEVLGLDWIRNDPEWKDAPDSEDEALRDRFWTKMLEAVGARTLAEWQQVFDHEKDVFAETFFDGTEAFEHPQMVYDGNIATVDHPELGTIREPDVLVKMARTPGTADRPVPGAGQHDAELRAQGPRPVAPPTAGGPPPDDRPPLDGLTIVDIGSFYAGPFGSAMMADLGARVIKVEPIAGDPIRFAMPIPESAAVRVTQGKESLAIDAFSPAGREILVDLIRHADLVLHSYRGGVAERMGLDAASMLAINPRLIYHHGVGYGLDGPYARRSAYAPTIAAASGFARRCGGGGPEGEPLTIEQIKDLSTLTPGAPSGHPDGYAALGVAVGMALALAARSLGAGGQETCTSMISTMSHVLGDVMIDYPSMPPLPAVDDDGYGFGALDRLYETADGWLMLCVTADDEWDALRRELAGEVQIDVAARAGNDHELASALAAAFARRPAADWEKTLTAAGVAGVEVAPSTLGLMMAVFSDGALADQLGMMTKVDHPLFEEHGRTTALVTLSRSGTVIAPGVLIGQHTDAILAELGYDGEKIASLRAAGVVGG